MPRGHVHWKVTGYFLYSLHAAPDAFALDWMEKFFFSEKKSTMCRFCYYLTSFAE